MAYEYVEDLHRQNVVYAEIRYKPYSDVVGAPNGKQYCDAIITGLERGERDFNVKVRSILCFMRDNPGGPLINLYHTNDNTLHYFTEKCADLVVLARSLMSRGVVGVDIAGDELLPLDQRHIDGFLAAKKQGLHVTVHAGESGPADNVRQAIQVLGAERIGHGYHVVDNDHIYEIAKKSGVHFEVKWENNISF